MENVIKLTEQSLNIINTIHKKGGKRVRISANDLKQNKNFYFRVVQLEQKELIFVERVIGEKSYYTLTDKGYKVLIKHKTDEMNDCLQKIGMDPI